MAAPNHLQLDHTLIADVDDIDIAGVRVDVGPNFIKRLVHALVKIVHVGILACGCQRLQKSNLCSYRSASGWPNW